MTTLKTTSTGNKAVEDSILLRVLWGLQASVCILMIGCVDPDGMKLNVGGVQLPLLILYLWVGLSGCYLSYHYRHENNKWLEIAGTALIVTIAVWFYDNLQQQYMSGLGISLMLPLIYLMSGLFISHSFELRSRFDFNFSLVLSLLLIIMIAMLGKGLFFGLLAFTYIFLAAAMLLLDAEAPARQRLNAIKFAYPVISLTWLTIGFFVLVPRAESVVDEMTTKLHSIFNGTHPSSTKTTSGAKPRKYHRRRKEKSVGIAISNFSKGQESTKEARYSNKTESILHDKKERSADNSSAANQVSNITHPQQEPQRKSSTPPDTTPSNVKSQPSGSPPITQKPASAPAKTNTNLPKPHESSSSGTHNDKQSPSRPLLPEDSMPLNLPSPQAKKLLFSVSANRTVFLKQVCFDYFDGQKWTASNRKPDTKLQKESPGLFKIAENRLLSCPKTIPSTRLSQAYKIEADLGNHLITAGSPVEIYLPDSDIFIDTTGTLISNWNLVPGMEYKTVSDLGIYDFATLRKAPLPKEELEDNLRGKLSNFLQLPETQSDDVYEMAEKVAGLQNNWFVQSERIAVYLRKSYRYCLKTETTSEDLAPDLTKHFLFKSRSGDCKDFASAFVILCRSAGIPARLIVGFGPGTFNPVLGVRQIREKDAHAWAEVYVPDSGWIAFDPTPDGILPIRAKESEAYFSGLQKSIAQNFSEANVETIAKQERSKPITPIAANLSSLPLIAILELLALSIAGFSIIVAGKTLSIRWKNRKPIHPASKVYNRVLRTLNKLGITSTANETPEEILQKLQSAGEPSIKEKGKIIFLMTEFVRDYNKLVFGQGKELARLQTMERELIQLLLTNAKQFNRRRDSHHKSL